MISARTSLFAHFIIWYYNLIMRVALVNPGKISSLTSLGYEHLVVLLPVALGVPIVFSLAEAYLVWNYITGVCKIRKHLSD